MNRPTRIERFALVFAGTACVVSAAIGGVMAATPAHAETVLQSLKIQSMNQSMNGRPITCHAAYIAPHSQPARDCRRQGWSVMAHLSVSPDDRAFTDWEPCAAEDSRRCYWNARTMGNGRGHSFVDAGHNGTFYVHRINGHRA